MWKKLVCLAVTSLVMVSAASATTGPVGWWKFDEMSGKLAADSSGNGMNGTLLPASGGPTWVTGKLGGALKFNGTSDCVDLGKNAAFNPTGSFTVTYWANITAWGADWGHVMMGNRGEDNIGWQIRAHGWYGPRLCFTTRGAGNDDMGSNTNPMIQNQWVHVACVYDNAANTKTIVLNGIVDVVGATTAGGSVTATTHNTYIGARANGGNSAPESFFTGMMDDVRLYDRALSADEAMNAMSGGIGYGNANSAAPAPKATDVLRDQTLSWKAGPDAVAHNVYFGTDPANLKLVGNAQTTTSYNPGRMQFGTTYYWRVDEIGATGTVYGGSLWSFTTELYHYKVASITVKASASAVGSDPNKTIDNSGIDANDQCNTDEKSMWVTPKANAGGKLPVWIRYDFDKVYVLDQMWVWNYNSASESDVGIGAKDTTIEFSADGTNWTSLGSFEFADCDGLDGYIHNTEVSLKGVAAKSIRLTIKSSWQSPAVTGLSEVRFYYLPASAASPNPANGGTGVRPDVSLAWRPGRGAGTHNVYFGTDPNALVLTGSVPANTVAPTFAPAGLQLDAVKYYWRVDEVNNANVIPLVAGEAWSFTTLSNIVVDDMESYNDIKANGTTIYQTWVDGYNSTTNGSQVGNINAPFAEKTIVAGGSQSMPLQYANTASEPISEATRTFATPQDWTIGGITTLGLALRGDLNSVGTAAIYVKINSVKVDFTGTLQMSPIPMWAQWNIDLSKVAGVNSVKSLTIGVSGVGASGILYIDNVCLYKTAPVVKSVDPGTTNLVAYYAMSDNLKDSSSQGNDGVAVGAPTFVAGLFGKALNLNGTADSVDLGKKDVFNFSGSFTISLWANIGSWATQWGCVMMGNRGEDSLGWQIRRGGGTGVCFTTRGVGNDDMEGLTPPTGQWMNVTCVYDNVANTKTLYLNGQPNISQTTTAGAKIAATTHNTYIGARANSGNSAPESLFTGMLDEVRVYNRALTSNEVFFLSGGK
jgi:hypothetical protein